MPARKLYFESIRVGDELPALATAPVARVQHSRYAGASGASLAVSWASSSGAMVSRSQPAKAVI